MRAGLQAGAHPDDPGVLVDDAFGDPQAETGAGTLLGGVKGLEEMGAHFGREA